MGDVVGGREAVGKHIDLLKGRYGDFAVNQTTVTVPAESYRRARRRTENGIVDAYVRVWNDDGEALHLRCDSAFPIESADTSLAGRVRAAVRASTDIDVAIEDVDRVTIAGIRNEDAADAPAVYRLFVLFDAEYAGGDRPDELEWEADAAVVPEFVSGA